MRRGALGSVALAFALAAPEAASAEVSAAAVEGTSRDVDATETKTSLRGSGAWLEVPACAAKRRALVVDGRALPPPDASRRILPLAAGTHDIELVLEPSPYERGAPCGGPLVVGSRVTRPFGLVELAFDAPAAARARGGGKAVAFVPKGHDPKTPGAVLVGLHPWNGSPWTYAAYRDLLAEAEARDVVLLFPSGLGNSLYVAEAEDEALRALAALGRDVAVDAQRVSVWGASMGGAGATTIALHRPDRFASVSSFFGDATYDLTTYVKAILRDEAGARRVNALDAVGSARHLDVLLVHGEADKVSPLRQSTLLDDALRARGYRTTLVRAPGRGHDGSLVRDHVREVVRRAATARAPRAPTEVTIESARDEDISAYGVTLERVTPGKRAYVDVAAVEGRVVVRAAENVRALTLDAGALGAPPGAPVDGAVPVRWRAP